MRPQWIRLLVCLALLSIYLPARGRDAADPTEGGWACKLAKLDEHRTRVSCRNIFIQGAAAAAAVEALVLSAAVADAVRPRIRHLASGRRGEVRFLDVEHVSEFDTRNSYDASIFLPHPRLADTPEGAQSLKCEACLDDMMKDKHTCVPALNSACIASRQSAEELRKVLISDLADWFWKKTSDQAR